MKKLQIALIVSLLASPLAAHAAKGYCNPDRYSSGYNDSGMKVDQCGNLDIGYYVSSCSHFYDIGYSSQFGAYEDYDGPYPETGWFSSELEHTRQIKSDDVKFYKNAFKEAHEFQYSAYRSLAQMEFGLQRNKSLMESDPTVFQAYQQKFYSMRENIEGQIVYNVNKTYNDIKQKLSYVDPSLINRGNSYNQEEIITSWTYYQECKQWWSHEERNIQYLKSEYPDVYRNYNK